MTKKIVCIDLHNRHYKKHILVTSMFREYCRRCGKVTKIYKFKPNKTKPIIPKRKFKQGKDIDAIEKKMSFIYKSEIEINRALVIKNQVLDTVPLSDIQRQELEKEIQVLASFNKTQ